MPAHENFDRPVEVIRKSSKRLPVLLNMLSYLGQFEYLNPVDISDQKIYHGIILSFAGERYIQVAWHEVGSSVWQLHRLPGNTVVKLITSDPEE